MVVEAWQTSLGESPVQARTPRLEPYRRGLWLAFSSVRHLSCEGDAVSLLDYTRRLARLDPYFDPHDGAPESEMVCIACSQYRKYGHADDCLWLSMPKIIAVIEAAERVVEVAEDCGDCIEIHDAREGAWGQFVAALKGDTA